jgi:predicted  nucleic acid-binding Zn-ribbon protein
MKIIEKLSTYAALLGVIGAIGGGFYTWGQFNLRLDQIENQEFVVNETVDLTEVNDSINNINIKLTELETTIIGLDNDVLDNLRNDIAGNSNDMKAITQDIIKDIKVIQSVLADAASNDDIDELDKKLRKPLKELEEYAWELEEDIEQNTKDVAIIKKENELQDIQIEEIKISASNPLGG